MNAKLKVLLSAAALSLSLGATGCIVHDRPGYYDGYGYGHSYGSPGVYVRGSSYHGGYDHRRYDDDRHDHDRYDQGGRHDDDHRSGDNCWYSDGRRYCRR